MVFVAVVVVGPVYAVERAREAACNTVLALCALLLKAARAFSHFPAAYTGGPFRRVIHQHPVDRGPTSDRTAYPHPNPNVIHTLPVLNLLRELPQGLSQAGIGLRLRLDLFISVNHCRMVPAAKLLPDPG